MGDKPELRYGAAREALARLGHDTTLSYLAEMAALVLKETGLLPHLNPGRDDPRRNRRGCAPSRCRRASCSKARPSGCRARGGPHFGSPDKAPAVRLATIAAAGEAAVPFTSGILIGIGETRRERIEALLALRDLHDRYGHIQEIIVQNFRAKPGTRMADAPEPDLDRASLDDRRRAADLRPGDEHPGAAQSDAGRARRDDRGRDQRLGRRLAGHPGPRQPRGAVAASRRSRRAAPPAAGKLLVERLAIYPSYAQRPGALARPGAAHRRCCARSTRQGFARPDAWIAGSGTEPPCPHPALPRELRRGAAVLLADMRAEGGDPRPQRGECRVRVASDILDRAAAGETLAEADIVRLFAGARRRFRRGLRRRRPAAPRGVRATRSPMSSPATSTTPISAISAASSAPSRRASSAKTCAAGPTTSTSTRSSAAQSRRPGSAARPKSACRAASTRNTPARPISRSAARSSRRCPACTSTPSRRSKSGRGRRRSAAPLPDFLRELRDAGLGSLPGTAAEILDDEVRAVICPDKVKTARMARGHGGGASRGLRSTVTIMFGHVERYEHWARHLLRVRALQAADRRLYRVRAVAVRADGDADLR